MKLEAAVEFRSLIRLLSQVMIFAALDAGCGQLVEPAGTSSVGQALVAALSV